MAISISKLAAVVGKPYRRAERHNRQVAHAPPTPRLAPRRVLVVDDDAGNRRLSSITLELAGHVVLEEADGSRGLARALSDRPDLIVSDVLMPGLDGYELAKALRGDKRTRKIPLVFLSGEPEPEVALRATELGAHGCLQKPFDPPALVSLVARALARRDVWELPTNPAA